jgi:predicted RND superfamily exporter protein
MSPWNRFLASLAKRRWITLAALVAILGASAAALPGIRFSTGITEHLPMEDAAVRQWLESSQRFGAFDSLIVGLEEPQKPFTAEGLKRLQTITKKLEDLKADGVVWVRSVTNLDSIRESEDGSLNPELFLTKIPEDEAGLAALLRRAQGDAQIAGSFASRDGRGYAIMLRLDPKADAGKAAERIRQAVEAERGPLASYYFGAPFFTAAVGREVGGRLPWLLPAILVALLGMLGLGLRRVSSVVIALGGALGSVLAWVGILRLAKLGLSQGTVAVGIVVFGIALVLFARGVEAWRARGEAEALLPATSVAGLLGAAIAAVVAARLVPGLCAGIALALAAGCAAVIVVAMLGLTALATLPKVAQTAAAPEKKGWHRRWGFTLAAVAIAAAWSPASGLRLLTTPQTMFCANEEVGRSLAFFDRRFGGSDFIQIGLKGDFRDPAVAAQVLRLGDVLESTGAFADVRSISQVLAFLNRGFGGIQRIPATRDSLANLWFFLEGSADVHSVVSDGRDEGMVMVRIPSHPQQSMAELDELVSRAIADSALVGERAASVRLHKLAHRFEVKLSDKQLAEVLALATSSAADPALEATVREGLHKWLDSPDSPYTPSDEEWQRFEPLLARGEAAKPKLIELGKGLPGFDEAMSAQLADTLLERQRDLRLTERSRLLAERLAGEAAPAEFLARAQGAFAELLDPAQGNAKATFTVSGLPVVSEVVEARQVPRLWHVLAALLAGIALIVLLVSRKPVASLALLLAMGAASAVTAALGSMLGLHADPLSAPLYLAPAVVVAALGHGRERSAYIALAAVAAVGLCLLGAGSMLVVRLGAVVAMGCAVSAVSAFAATCFGLRAETAAEGGAGTSTPAVTGG